MKKGDLVRMADRFGNGRVGFVRRVIGSKTIVYWPEVGAELIHQTDDLVVVIYER